MKKSLFSEDQIIGILKEQQAGLPGDGDLSTARDQQRDVLQVAVAVRRDGGVGRSSAEDSRR